MSYTYSDTKQGIWHNQHKSDVYNLFGQKCSRCSELTTESAGVAHHTTYRYKDGVYKYAAKELVDAGVVVWVCHRCHELIHRTTRIDGLTRLIDDDDPYCDDDLYEVWVDNELSKSTLDSWDEYYDPND